MLSLLWLALSKSLFLLPLYLSLAPCCFFFNRLDTLLSSPLCTRRLFFSTHLLVENKTRQRNEFEASRSGREKSVSAPLLLTSDIEKQLSSENLPSSSGHLGVKDGSGRFRIEGCALSKHRPPSLSLPSSSLSSLGLASVPFSLQLDDLDGPQLCIASNLPFDSRIFHEQTSQSELDSFLPSPPRLFTDPLSLSQSLSPPSSYHQFLHLPLLLRSSLGPSPQRNLFLPRTSGSSFSLDFLPFSHPCSPSPPSPPPADSSSERVQLGGKSTGP